MSGSLGHLWGGKTWATVTTTESNGTLTITVDGKTSEDDASTVAKAVNTNITAVVVKGGTINDKFFHSIVYGQYSANTSITSIDLSETDYTNTTLPRTFFYYTEENPHMVGALQVSSFSFPKNITKIDDSACKGVTCLANITFPAGLKTIGKFAFQNDNKITTITFPTSLEKIDDGAFAMCPIKDLKFNNKLRFIGNSAFAYSSAITEETLTIPASVKYIGPSAFYFRQYQDVYFQGKTAPIMPYGTSVAIQNVSGIENTAFSSHTLMGNNGFQPNGGNNNYDNANEGWANRENYTNKGVYFCVLHYPKGLTDTEKDTYVDITRVYKTQTEGTFKYNYNGYTIGEETSQLKAGSQEAIGKEVCYGFKDTYLGDQYIWPSQSQWMRAYTTAALGLRWNGKDTYAPTLTDEDKAIFAEAGYTIGTGDGEYTEAELCKMAHQGTRMFVLANNDAQSSEYQPSIKKDGTWWTVCVPFNMTKKQVKEAFGESTELYLFDAVTREIDVNNRNHILIRFATNPMTKKTADADGNKMKWDASENTDQESGHEAGEWKYSDINSDNNGEPGDDDIVIWAHESYMIKPMNGENSDQDPAVVISGLTPVPGNPLPSVVRAKTVRKTQDEGNYENCYRFIGNYSTGVKMPQYSYFFGTGTNDNTEKFRFYTGTKSYWKANKSIIQASAHDGGAEDYQNFFGGNQTSAAKVMQTTLFGFDDKDNKTTGIDDVKFVIGNETLSPVFTLDGKLMNVSGDTTSLAKGVYVKAGKKFVVQ